MFTVRQVCTTYPLFNSLVSVGAGEHDSSLFWSCPSTWLAAGRFPPPPDLADGRTPSSFAGAAVMHSTFAVHVVMSRHTPSTHLRSGRDGYLVHDVSSVYIVAYWYCGYCHIIGSVLTPTLSSLNYIYCPVGFHRVPSSLTPQSTIVRRSILYPRAGPTLLYCLYGDTYLIYSL